MCSRAAREGGNSPLAQEGRSPRDRAPQSSQVLRNSGVGPSNPRTQTEAAQPAFSEGICHGRV